MTMRLVSRSKLALTVAFCAGFLPISCARELTPAEKAFYRRADQITRGSTMDVVRGQLGPPSSVRDAEGECAAEGGSRTWTYSSFDDTGRRQELRAGTLAYCFDALGVVLSVRETF